MVPKNQKFQINQDEIHQIITSISKEFLNFDTKWIFLNNEYWNKPNDTKRNKCQFFFFEIKPKTIHSKNKQDENLLFMQYAIFENNFQ